MAEVHFTDDIKRVGMVLIGFFREANDEVPRDQNIGARIADALDQLEIAVAGVGAVHALEDFV